MPNILIRIPQGSLASEAKAELASRITRAAAEAEQIPDEPGPRSLCWVLVEEIAQGSWSCGGIDMTAKFIPVMLQLFVPGGVMDDTRRKGYAAAIDSAIREAFAHEARRIVVSCIFTDVPDGHWGVDGQLWQLADFTRHAKYRHLQPAASH